MNRDELDRVNSTTVPVVECPTCHLPVPASDTLCPACGSLIPDEAWDPLR